MVETRIGGKGKPVARRGRKARVSLREAARLPKKARGRARPLPKQKAKKFLTSLRLVGYPSAPEIAPSACLARQTSAS